MPALPLTGHCQCGAAAYRVTAQPEAIYVCHCRECQRQSASAFGISVSVAKAHFHLDWGEVGCWSRRTDSGRILHCHFCSVCGSRLWHEGPGWDVLSVKGGSLDVPPDLSDAIHIWTSRRLPGVVIPEAATQFPEEPV
ncbi:MAG: GFA family protein [Geminicoccaceae bacterium]